MSQELQLACCKGFRYATAKTLCLYLFLLDFSTSIHSTKNYVYYCLLRNCFHRQKEPLQVF